MCSGVSYNIEGDKRLNFGGNKSFNVYYIGFGVVMKGGIKLLTLIF